MVVWAVKNLRDNLRPTLKISIMTPLHLTVMTHGYRSKQWKFNHLLTTRK